MTRARKTTAFTLSWACIFAACSRHGSAPDTQVKAQVGIFFGGQIQSRSEWPLVLDRARQTQGFRLEFRQVLREPAHVTWEIVRPAAQQKRHGSLHGESNTSSFDVTVPAGANRFDQLIPFADNDRVGEWKLQVLVNGISVLSRSIRVVSRTTNTTDD